MKKPMRRSWPSLLLLAPIVLSQDRATASTASFVRVELGHSVSTLNGPWRFHAGDDLHWADPDFDDSAWETIDLTPPPGAHDSNVGLSGYAPGWQAKGHRGYFGYAWYRLRVSVNASPGESLALCGPLYVDSAYQMFVNGRLVGGLGDFSARTPVARNNHRPTIFPLPKSSALASAENKGFLDLAVRVWMGPWALRSSDTGGIHIAPALGTMPGAEALYEHQWFETIRGYLVDAVEAVLFLLLAAMVCLLIPLDRSSSAYPWMATALILTGLARGNQAVFFWGRFETIHEFEIFTILLFVPLSLAAWTLTWPSWLGLRDAAWIRPVVAVLTPLYVGLELSRRTWFYGVFPRWAGVSTNICLILVRLVFVLLTFRILFRSMSRQRREGWLAPLSILLVSVGLYAQELSMLHIPGIWFPFGTGVSRTEYAYAAFDVVLFLLLSRRLLALARCDKQQDLASA